MENLTPTTPDELKRYANNMVVELPPFGDGRPFVARLKKPQVERLAMTGRIPNVLMETVMNMFEDTQGDVKKTTEKLNTLSKEEAEKLYEYLEIIAQESLAEPTVDDVHAAGLELTDEQLGFIFAYVQGGVKALEPFREERTDTVVNQDGQELPSTPEFNSRDHG